MTTGKKPEKDGTEFTWMRLQRLALKFGLRQLDVANRSGGRLSRELVNRYMTGNRKASTYTAVLGLAEAFFLTVDQMRAYMDRNATLEQAVDWSEANRLERARTEIREGAEALRAAKKTIKEEYSAIRARTVA